jgi:hypothetical protein
MVEFATYQDQVGNVQTTPIEYSVTVEGQGDAFPIVDGMGYGYRQYFEEYEEGMLVDSGWYDEWIRFENESDDDYRQVYYDNDGFVGSDNWEYLTWYSDKVEMRGFHELDEGEPVDVTFTPPVIMAKKPWAAQSWNGDVVAGFPDGDANLEYSIQITGPTDRVAPLGAKPGGWMGKQPDEPELVWIGVWRMELQYQVTVGTTVVSSGTDVSWLAPAVGVVEEDSQSQGEGWNELSSKALMEIIPPEG